MPSATSSGAGLEHFTGCSQPSMVWILLKTTSCGPKAHHAHEKRITARPRNFQKGTSAITKGTSLLKNTMATHYAPRVPKPQQQLPEAPFTLQGSIVRALARCCSGMEPSWPRHHSCILLETFSHYLTIFGAAAKPKASLG